MLNDGQARRIAAEWHSPGTALSTLSHTGRVEARLVLEIGVEIAQNDLAAANAHITRGEWEQRDTDLRSLAAWAAARQGQDAQDGWSRVWDDTPADQADRFFTPDIGFECCADPDCEGH